jgi:Recombination endonuclease VII
MTKRCITCGEVKALDEFPKSFHKSRGKHYHGSYCRPCHRTHSLKRSSDKYHAKSAAERRAFNMRGKYGLSVEAYNAFLIRQGGACAICREVFTSKPQIDHNHSTGKVRGLLCMKCNTGIGKLRDSPAVLTRAALYLQEQGHVG